MTASIMMVTYNRLELTKETIQNIFNNTKYPYNLVVVDNGSTDDTIEWLLSLSNATDTIDALKNITIYPNQENKGIAIGRNQTLALASVTDTDWFVTMDNDVWVPEGWLTKCIDVLKVNRQYGGIGVNMENTVYPIVKKAGQVFQDKPRGNLGTACMVFNRSLHKMLGFFNYRDYKFYAHEDADWGMRTRVLGLKLGYIQEMGKHLGEGEYDAGEYREFKNKWHAQNLSKFNTNCGEYARRTKSLYIDFNLSDE